MINFELLEKQYFRKKKGKREPVLKNAW